MSSLGSLLIRTIILPDQGSILMTSFNLNCFLTPNTATLYVRESTYEFGAGAGRTQFSSEHMPRFPLLDIIC